MTSPPDHEQVIFLVKWWQEILSGAIIILTSWFLKSKGSKKEAIVHLSEAEIERRMDTCKKTILLAIHAELNVRDNKLFRHIETQDEKLLNHIKDILER